MTSLDDALPGRPDGAWARHAGAIASDASATSREGVPEAARAVVGRIDVATGAVRLGRTDLVLPGDLPLVVTRTHSSHWTYGHWFGPSWASTFDERVDLHLDAAGERWAVVVRADASAQVFAMPGTGGSCAPRAGGTTSLHRTPLGGFRLFDRATGLTRHYPASGTGRSWLGSITDVSAHTVAIVRDEDGAPVEVRHSAGHRVLVATDRRRVTGLRLVDASGRRPLDVATYEYDDVGDLVSELVSDRVGEPIGEMVGAGEEPRAATAFTYAAHRLTGWRDRDGTVRAYVYDTEGRCVSRTDETGRSTVAYGPAGPGGLRETAVTDAHGETTSYLVNGLFQVVRRTDPEGRETRTVWDAGNRLLARTDAHGGTTRYAYDTAGNLVVVTHPDGSHRMAEWTTTSSGPRPDRVSLPDGAVWSAAYDEAGRLVSETDHHGATTAYGYDRRGHLASVIDPRARLLQIETDAAGLPTRLIDADGRVTEIVRDRLGRPLTSGTSSRHGAG